jgi:hypothetical protein
LSSLNIFKKISVDKKQKSKKKPRRIQREIFIQRIENGEVMSLPGK